jgi:polysaccharide biosynthesis transport protein
MSINKSYLQGPDGENPINSNSEISYGRGQTDGSMLPSLLGRWYWILLMIVLCFLASLYYLSKAPKYYTATAELIVVLPDRNLTGSVMNVGEFDTTTVEGLNTIASNIGRKSLLLSVAKRLDILELEAIGMPDTDWRPEWWKNWTGAVKNPDDQEVNARQMSQEAIIEVIADSLVVDVIQKTRLLQISIKHRSAKCAEVIANAISVEYVSQATQTLSDSTKKSGSVMEIRASEDSKKLSEVQGSLANYAQAVMIQKELEYAEKNFQALSVRYKEKHPDMIEAKGNLENVQKRFISELGTAMSSPLDSLYWRDSAANLQTYSKDQVEYLNAVRQALMSRISVLEAQARSLQTMIQNLTTGVGMSAAGPSTATIRVNELATLPEEKDATPVPVKIIALGCGAGMMLGFLVAFLLAKFDNTFHTVAELEGETEVAVLAAIPAIPLNHIQAVMAHAAKKGKAGEENEHQNKWEPRLLFRPALKKTNYCESFRILRTSVTLLGDENRRRVTLISSSLPGEGKSTVSANLALASAAQGKRTLLIDFDLRKPRLHQVFGISEKPHDSLGASEWCAGTATLEECITKEVGAENLHVIFSGKRAADPGELLDPERIRELLADVREKYDSIIIDSAPLLAVPDTRLIAPVVDNFCLVVRSNWVPKGAVLRSLDLLESYGTRPSGLILNGHAETRKRINQNYSYGSYRISRFGKAYQYGYGSYGTYGSYGAEDDDDDDTPKQRKSDKKRV